MITAHEKETEQVPNSLCLFLFLQSPAVSQLSGRDTLTDGLKVTENNTHRSGNMISTCAAKLQPIRCPVFQILT